MITAEQVRQAVADIAATPMQMPLTKWGEVCGILLAAADEIERMEKAAAEAKAQAEWEDSPEGRWSAMAGS